MKKIKSLIAIILMMATSMVAMAQAGMTKDNPLVLEVGKTYKIDSKFNFKAIYAVFNATEDGVMTMTNNGVDELYLFTDQTYTEYAEVQPEWNGSYSPKEYALKVKAGQSYYLANDFVMNTGTITISFGTSVTPLELTRQTPAEGSVIKSSSDILTLEFNKNVTYNKIIFKSGAITTEMTGYISGCYLTIDIKETMMPLYKAGTLKKGDEVKFIIEGLCDARDNSNKYGTDGTLTLNYTAADKPVELVSANNVPQGTPNSMTTFSSWYMPTDESGVVTLTFDGELDIEGNNTPKASLSYGDLEMENGLYIENLDIKVIDNKTLSIDLRNKLRRHKDMLTIDQTFTEITLNINNVHGKDGQATYSESNSSFGSYSYVYNFKEVRYMVMSDFMPATSATKPASIDGVKSIELWLSEEGDKKMTYTGAWFITTFEGKADTTFVAKSDIKIEADEYDANATILTIPVPEFKADANSNVVVTLANVVTPDGVDHSANYSATYFTSGTTGIESISNNQGKANVYSIGGILIKKNASDAEIKNLRPGTYIINNKKVVR